MEQNQLAQLRSKLAPLWSRSRQWLLALPFKAQIVLTVFVLAALLSALHTALSGKDSSLHLRLQHGFRSAQLTVLIDGRKVYSGKLVGYSKKKYVLVGETVEGSLSQVFPVSSGTHDVLVRVEPGDGTVQEENLSGVFVSGVGRTLSITARHSGLTMSWAGESEAASTEVPTEASGPSWFSKYAGSLFLTVIGSIASALTGFAIKELPGYLRREENVPKASSQASAD
ncbi:MAG TPA: hypothetical protein VMT53_27420 [Terriglobales bacterium]|nr:hypothetical protein [Terriglobales bacterium]